MAALLAAWESELGAFTFDVVEAAVRVVIAKYEGDDRPHRAPDLPMVMRAARRVRDHEIARMQERARMEAIEQQERSAATPESIDRILAKSKMRGGEGV